MICLVTPACEDQYCILEILFGNCKQSVIRSSLFPRLSVDPAWSAEQFHCYQPLPFCTSTPYDYRKQTTDMPEHSWLSVHFVSQTLPWKQWTNLEITNDLTNNLRDFEFLTSCLQEGNDSWKCGEQVLPWTAWYLLLTKIKNTASTFLRGSEF